MTTDPSPEKSQRQFWLAKRVKLIILVGVAALVLQQLVFLFMANGG